MKELKLLPEDWKGEIDYLKAAFLISETGKHYMKFYHDKFIGTVMKLYDIGDIKHGITSVYEAKGLKLVELAPEPRPADSIKLSECDGKHIITCDNHTGSKRRITYETDENGSLWYVKSFDGGWCQRFACLVNLVKVVKPTNLHIFDMTQ